MTVGVLTNLSAGGGRAGSICAALAEKLAGHRILSVPGFGAELLPQAEPLEAPSDAIGYVGRVQDAAKIMAAASPDYLVLVGGDGFSAYVADALLTVALPMPRLIGVAGGTANVGPIVAMQSLPDSLEELAFAPVGAIEVLDDCGHIAYAFNDLVLGNTYLTTVDGQTVTASAEALWCEGRTELCEAMEDIGRICVTVNGRAFETRLPQVKQVIASTLERDRLYGRAVTGLLCFSPDSPYQGALLLSERGIVDLSDDMRGLDRPAAMEQLVFTKEDEIVLSGIADGVSAIIDGNPYQRTGSIRLRYCEDLLYAAEKKGETPWNR